MFFGKADKRRSAGTEDLQPPSSPAAKLHKDASGDIETAATLTADLPADFTNVVETAAATAQGPKADLATMLARLASLEQTVSVQRQEITQLKDRWLSLSPRWSFWSSVSGLRIWSCMAYPTLQPSAGQLTWSDL